jgi:hypothetical protein
MVGGARVLVELEGKLTRFVRNMLIPSQLHLEVLKLEQNHPVTLACALMRKKNRQVLMGRRNRLLGRNINMGIGS